MTQKIISQAETEDKCKHDCLKKNLPSQTKVSGLIFVLKGYPSFFSNFAGPGSIFRNHWLPLFWTSCGHPHGFQCQGGCFTCTFTCLCTVILRVMPGATPAFGRMIRSLKQPRPWIILRWVTISHRHFLQFDKNIRQICQLNRNFKKNIEPVVKLLTQQHH